MMFFRRGRCRNANKSNAGWVLIESLISLIVFAVVMGLLQQQNESDFSSISVLKNKAFDEYNAAQLLRLRRIKQDYTWLEGNHEAGRKSNCETCVGDDLNAWYLSWITQEQVLELPSTALLLGIDE